jgi:hypothetical protein
MKCLKPVSKVEHLKNEYNKKMKESINNTLYSKYKEYTKS